MEFQETVPLTASTISQTVTTSRRPLSPRFASLEISLSENKGNSGESLRYDGESRTSPRILNKADDVHHGTVEINNNRSTPAPSFTLSPVPFQSDLPLDFSSIDSGWGSYQLESNMSVSLDKTFDSESLSITSKPLWQELQDAGYGADGYTQIGEHHPNSISTDGKSGDIVKGEHGVKQNGSTENSHKKLVSTRAPTRFESFSTKAAGGSAKNSIGNRKDESETAVSLAKVDNSRSDPKNVQTVVRENDVADSIVNDRIVSDLKQTPVESNMERKLISSLPKKLREEAVLRTFANNLKAASSTTKFATSKRLSLEGRQSADSGRESVLEDESRPRLYRFDSSSSVSSVGSTRSAVRNGNSAVKPWSVVMMAETIKKRRQDAVRKGKQAKAELVGLVIF